ncbi:Anaphase-promoting complex subunit 4 WD40 domain-containing protein [Plasmodiophora brassicae]|uniref:Anaphase-promoting complex subunit 4 WD40 domain-containing protein n=1 Tax=Plasmodiophora brassicae TaxID=37360 RepID=A0A3P3Y6P6_PLABS|nr:unnamed protein product [Plasmodiophora brassicae]
MDLIWQSAQAPSCFKNVRWSPDGTCALTALDDGSIDLYELRHEDQGAAEMPRLRLDHVCRRREPEVVYDYLWNPLMTSQDPATCFFCTTARDQPVHIWDAFSGQLRSSIGAYDNGDDLYACLSIGITPDGATLYGGVSNGVFVFDLERGSRDRRRWTVKDPDGGDFYGLVSCMAFDRASGHGDIVALGSYSGMVGVFDEKSSSHLLTMPSHRRGVTSVKFSPCGLYLWSGGRCEPDLLCWDVRYAQVPLHRLPRVVGNHQRIDFDLERTGRYVITGGQDGIVRAYDVMEAPVPPSTAPAPAYFQYRVGPGDSCNGVGLHPSLPLAVTTSGQRHFPVDDADTDEERVDDDDVVDSAIRLWSVHLDAQRPVPASSPDYTNA